MVGGGVRWEEGCGWGRGEVGGGKVGGRDEMGGGVRWDEGVRWGKA